MPKVIYQRYVSTTLSKSVYFVSIFDSSIHLKCKMIFNVRHILYSKNGPHDCHDIIKWGTKQNVQPGITLL